MKFAGALHVWAEAECGLDLMLRVEDDSLELRGQDEDSGGGTTPYLHLKAEPGELLNIAVAAQVAESLEDFDVVQVHLVAAPESAAKHATSDLASAKQLQGEARL